MTRALLASAASLALLAACGENATVVTNTTSATTSAAKTETATPELGDFGVDLTARDLSVKPGDDFNLYANGTWIKETVIPSDRSRWGAFDVLRERSTERVRIIIEDLAAMEAAAGTDEQKIGDLYNSFMDEAALEALGIAPIEADLAEIASAETPEDIARLMTRADLGTGSIFGGGAGVDQKNPGFHTFYVSQSGLGLPDRDYYLSDDEKFVAYRAKYVEYLTTIMGLAGVAEAEAKAQSVLAIETQMAEIHWPRAKSRNRDLTYNPYTPQALVEYAPGFPWAAAFDEIGAPDQEKFVLRQNDAIQGLAALFAETDIETWKDYLTASYLRSNANYLTKAFDDADFEFYSKTLRGQPEQQDRWKRASNLVSGRLGEAVGKVYVKRYFPPSSKAQMEELVGNLVEAYRVRITNLDWMTDETKAQALDKLSKFTPKIGYPEKWEDYSALAISGDDLFGNIKRARAWARAENIKQLDEPVDPTEWGMTPQTVNAYYSPTRNEIVFPAAILQPPFFDPAADPAVNYAAIGGVIGHEIGHGFDDQGRKSDGDGNLRDWWTAEDAGAFETKADTLVAQYDAFEPIPGKFVNGRLTLGENIGDLGGLSVAYHAYKLSLGGEEAPVLDDVTGDQRFFLGWAQVWRGKRREESLLQQLVSDSHSPGQYRINGVVRNIDAWYDAFEVSEDDALYLAPEDRVRIW